jgi:hypothetical protein
MFLVNSFILSEKCPVRCLYWVSNVQDTVIKIVSEMLSAFWIYTQWVTFISLRGYALWVNLVLTSEGEKLAFG